MEKKKFAYHEKCVGGKKKRASADGAGGCRLPDGTTPAPISPQPTSRLRPPAPPPLPLAA